MLDLKGIKNIVFDLGGVLLNLDFDATIRAFEKLGLDKAVMDKSTGYADKVFYALELGQVTPEMFRTRIRELLHNQDLTDKLIDDAWSAMILDIPQDRVNILKRLGSGYRIYLYSNTNRIHIEKLYKWFRETYLFEFPELFTSVLYSHEIHDRKPELSSFQKVANITGINPGESVFIDDLEKNIIAAEEAGFKTFWLRSPLEFKDLFQLPEK